MKVPIGCHTFRVTGVTGYLEERDFSSILRAAGDAQEAAERLVEEAVQRGGADNATAVVVRRR